MPAGTRNGLSTSVPGQRLLAASSSWLMAGQAGMTERHSESGDPELGGTSAEFQQIWERGCFPQSYPEGSPTHPAYPTGHGVVGGACITVLKFFFDGTFVIPISAGALERRAFAVGLYGIGCVAVNRQW